MRDAVAALVSISLAACASTVDAPPVPPGARPLSLRNAGFEEPQPAGARCPPGWNCTMHSNPDSFRFALDASAPAEGARSLCIERVIGEPWAVASQPVQARELRGRKLRFSVALRADRLDGDGAGPWVLVNGANGMLVHEERVAKLGAAWERRSIVFDVPAQAEGIDVGATLIGGGRVCLDDARLEPA